LFSSVEAFARTLYVHRKTTEKQRNAAVSIQANQTLQADLLTKAVASDDERASLTEQEIATEEEAQFASASAASVGDTSAIAEAKLYTRERQLLGEMAEIAETTRALPDARITKLVGWIKASMCPDLGTAGAKWNNLRVIIFTEWEDTRRYLYQQLSAAISDSDRAEQRIAVFHGPTPADEREEIKTAFNTEPEQHPVRILIATDAAREGLNLQAHCWNVFHFDVPWNPSRMEQRNGRVDRKLQPNPEVYCHYFFYKQRPEDRVLQALVRKTKTIREELGSLSQVIDSKLDDLMKGGIRRSDVNQLVQSIDTANLEKDCRDTVEEELEVAREREVELRAQIERLSTLLERSQESIGFSTNHFRSALSSALEIMGADPLKPSPNGHGLARCEFPALDQRPGADPSWAETMDSLRAPRPRDQKFWQWRRTSPIRPIVFEDPGIVTEEVVQMHLEQRVVQRLLSRFMAQGFVHHDLSRACMAQTTDAVPRVLLIGRLALYGPGAARLHEELIPVTARWVDPQIRKGQLAPYGREAEAKTMTLLDSTLLEKHARPVPEIVLGQLQAAAPRDVRELLPHLETRGAEYAKDAIAKLRGRAAAESQAMMNILDAQKKHLSETVKKNEKIEQLHLFNEEEQRQLESNRRYWAKRLIELDGEVKTEPDRIRALYQVRAQRVEPVGLVYLWPVTR
jgi:superfamily II DNA/RNA helicase